MKFEKVKLTKTDIKNLYYCLWDLQDYYNRDLKKYELLKNDIDFMSNHVEDSLYLKRKKRFNLINELVFKMECQAHEDQN